MFKSPNGSYSIIQESSEEAEDNQPQMDNPIPPYVDIDSGYHTARIDIPPPYPSVKLQADNDVVELQTESSCAQEGQPQKIQPSGSWQLEHPPPLYKDVASGDQTAQGNLSPPFAFVQVQACDDIR